LDLDEAGIASEPTVPATWLKRYRLVVEGLLTACAGVLLLATITKMADPWKSVVIGVGAGVIAGGTLAIMEALFHADIESLLESSLKPLIAKLESKLGGVEKRILAASSGMADQAEVYATGMSKVLLRREMNIIVRQMGTASRIDLAFNTARSIVMDNGSAIKNAIERGASVRLLITDPDNEHWKDPIVKSAQGPDIEVKQDVAAVRGRLTKWARDWAQDTPNNGGSLAVRMFKHVPTCSLMLIYFEERGVQRAMCWVTPYLPYVNSSSVATIGIRNVPIHDEDDNLFGQFSDAFNRVWEADSSVPCDEMSYLPHDVPSPPSQ